MAKKKGKGRTTPRRAQLYAADDGRGIILVDCNNVRGSSPEFDLPLATFVVLLALWTREVGLTGRVMCVVDHGQTSDAFMLGGQLLVVLAGNGRTADDIICDDALGISNAPTVIDDDEANDWSLDKLPRKVAVVTNDRGLKNRCLKQPAGVDGASRPGHISMPFSRVGRVKCFGSDEFKDLLKRVVAPGGLPGCSAGFLEVPACLAPLEGAELRLREALGLRDASGGFVREVTWHRVLAAELLRRCLAKAEATGELAAALDHFPRGAVACADLVGAELGAHVSVDEHGAFGGGIGAATDARLFERYVCGRRRPMDPSRGLAWDHRIRHDDNQKYCLGAYMRRDMEGGWPGRGIAGATVEETAGPIIGACDERAGAAELPAPAPRVARAAAGAAASATARAASEAAAKATADAEAAAAAAEAEALVAEAGRQRQLAADIAEGWQPRRSRNGSSNRPGTMGKRQHLQSPCSGTSTGRSRGERARALATGRTRRFSGSDGDGDGAEEAAAEETETRDDGEDDDEKDTQGFLAEGAGDVADAWFDAQLWV